MNRVTIYKIFERDELLTSYRNRQRVIIIVVSVMLLFAVRFSASSQMVSISARFDTTAIMIGEQTDFIVTVEQPDDMQLFFPLIKDTLSADIEILRVLPADTIRRDNSMLQIRTGFRVTSFEPGFQYVQPLPFVFLLDGDEKILYTARTAIEVVSPEIDPSEGVFDIKSPFGIPVGLLEVLRWLLPALLLLLAGWYLYKLFRRRQGDHPVDGSVKYTEPAHTYALRELKLLKEQSLWQKGMIKEYYSRLTEIIRIYIERRFSIRAMEQTSEEILLGLENCDMLSKETIALLKDMFTTADLVKFARYTPGREDHEGCINTAFRFVKETFEDIIPNNQVEPDGKTGAGSEKEVSPVKSAKDE